MPYVSFTKTVTSCMVWFTLYDVIDFLTTIDLCIVGIKPYSTSQDWEYGRLKKQTAILKEDFIRIQLMIF